MSEDGTDAGSMFEWVTETIANLGYCGVFVLALLENLFPPVPSEVVIPLAGFVAATGRLQLSIVVAVATLGSLCGAWLWYEFARRVGQPRLRGLVAQHGRWLTLSPRDIDRSSDWFRRHGGAAVLVGRLVPGVRTLISVPAGLAGLPRGRFLVYSAAGTLVWTWLLAWAGFALQQNFVVVERYADVLTKLGLMGVVVSVAWRYARCFGVVGRADPVTQ